MSAVSKRHLAALERLFVASIEGDMPCQFRPKLTAELVAEGLAEPHEVKLLGRIPVTVLGVVITIRGHMAYCEWAATQPSDEGELDEP